MGSAAPALIARLKVGDRILVNPGVLVPTDGVVIEEAAAHSRPVFWDHFN